MVCTIGPCTSERTDTILSRDGSFLYSFTLFGNSVYLYLSMINSTDGSVIGSRYKSSLTCVKIYGSSFSDEYILVSVNWGNFYISLFNTATFEFTFKQFTGSFILQQEKDPKSGR